MLRGGIDLWVDEDVARRIGHEFSEKKLIQVGERRINPDSIIGIFPSEDIEARNRRRRGEWKCAFEHWHTKDGVCDHHMPEESAKSPTDAGVYSPSEPTLQEKAITDTDGNVHTLV